MNDNEKRDHRRSLLNELHAVLNKMEDANMFPSLSNSEDLFEIVALGGRITLTNKCFSDDGKVRWDVEHR